MKGLWNNTHITRMHGIATGLASIAFAGGILQREVSNSRGLSVYSFMTGWKISTNFDSFCLFYVIYSYLFIDVRMICHPLVTGVIWVIWQAKGASHFVKNAHPPTSVGSAEKRHSSSTEKANFPIKFCEQLTSPIKTLKSCLLSFSSNVIRITQ